jgi:glutathione peroxidase-family protein
MLLMYQQPQTQKETKWNFPKWLKAQRTKPILNPYQEKMAEI